MIPFIYSALTLSYTSLPTQCYLSGFPNGGNNFFESTPFPQDRWARCPYCGVRQRIDNLDTYNCRCCGGALNANVK